MQQIQSPGRGGPEYLVSPSPFETVRHQVLFAHPASGNSATFLSEAIELAELGVQSYLIDFNFERDEDDPAHLRHPEKEVTFRRDCLKKVQDKAGLLLTLSQSCRNLTFVGKNFGAFVGGMVAGSDLRFSKFILAAGLPNLTEFYATSDHEVARAARHGTTEAELEKYRLATSPLNPTRLLPKTSPGHST